MRASAFALLLAACTEGAAPPPGTPAAWPQRPWQPFELVLPAVTDARITMWTEYHYVLEDAATLPVNGELFVFFPGTNMLPQDYQLILQAAAFQGYQVNGLRYANPFDVQ